MSFGAFYRYTGDWSNANSTEHARKKFLLSKNADNIVIKSMSLSSASSLVAIMTPVEVCLFQPRVGYNYP
ncbi:MAG: hypothetical protein CMK36_07810 [Porticoccaceae bacterium]|nr:hypothetical protein [Porticoccaceae bacterium]